MKVLLVIVGIIVAVVVGAMAHTADRAHAPVVGIDTSAPRERSALEATEPLVEIQDGVRVSKTIKVADLSNRSFSGSLKAEVRQLSELRELNLSNNNFTGVPAEIGQLTKLEVLNLSNNPITGLPYELGNLASLQVLDLRGTNYAVQDLEVIKQSLPSSVQILTD